MLKQFLAVEGEKVIISKTNIINFKTQAFYGLIEEIIFFLIPVIGIVLILLWKHYKGKKYSNTLLVFGIFFILLFVFMVLFFIFGGDVPAPQPESLY